MICPSCGENVDDKRLFCPTCGERFDAEQTDIQALAARAAMQKEAATIQEEWRGSRSLYLLVALAVLLVIAALAYKTLRPY